MPIGVPPYQAADLHQHLVNCSSPGSKLVSKPGKLLCSLAVSRATTVVPGKVTCRWLVGAELKHVHNVEMLFTVLRHF